MYVVYMRNLPHSNTAFKCWSLFHSSVLYSIYYADAFTIRSWICLWVILQSISNWIEIETEFIANDFFGWNVNDIKQHMLNVRKINKFLIPFWPIRKLGNWKIINFVMDFFSFFFCFQTYVSFQFRRCCKIVKISKGGKIHKI